MCIRDSIQTQAAFKTYWAKRLEEDPDIDPYNDLFCDLLEENAKAHPKYQGDCGDWLNWTVPDTDCNLPIFASGWGDGYYPVYFGYDAKGEVCAVYVLSLIHIEICIRDRACPKRASISSLPVLCSTLIFIRLWSDTLFWLCGSLSGIKTLRMKPVRCPAPSPCLPWGWRENRGHRW